MMYRHTIGAAIMLSLMSGSLLHATTIDEVKISASALGPNCRFIDGDYAVSMGARTLYEMINNSQLTALMSPPAKKLHQSVACGNDKGTVYYYEYSSTTDLDLARGFVEGLVWGKGGRSSLHPERILSKENVLLVISSPSAFDMERYFSPAAAQTATARPEEISPRTFPLPNHGAVRLPVPRSWNANVRQPPGDMPPEIVLSPQQGQSFVIVLTPVYANERRKAKRLTLASVKKTVRQQATEAAKQAVEKEIPLHELRGNGTAGYYFFATDSAPKPDEWKYMHQGMIVIGDLAFTFTVLTNDDAVGVAEHALMMIRNAVHERTAS